jgi:zinc-ribbon domain
MNCGNCGSQNEAGAKFCASCGNGLVAVATATSTLDTGLVRGGPVVRQVGDKIAVGKSPALASILSVLVGGGGQVYNGDAKKGVFMFVLAIVVGFFTGGIAYFAIAPWSVFDAYQVASGKFARW